jgi:hypothetical protein
MMLLAPGTAATATGWDSVVKARVLNPLEDTLWDQSVAAHPQAGPFHASAWFQVVAETYGHHPCALALLRRGLPVALVPLMEVDSVLTGRRGVGMPFADAAEPLLFERIDSRMLVDVLARLGESRAWRHVEVRGSAGIPETAPASVSFWNHQLDLRGGLEAVKAGFEPSVRRALRKAEREAIQVDVRHDAAAVRSFLYLHALTRKRHGLPPQPDRFFEAIRRRFLEPGKGALVLASHQGKPISAVLFLLGGTRAVYKFGASEKSSQITRANNLAFWHGVQWSAAAGADWLDFGRTSCSQDGLRRFKRGWGAVESPLRYHSLALPARDWTTGSDRSHGAHTRLFSHLPLAVNRLAGAALYPHLD